MSESQMRQALFFKRLAGSYDQLVQYVRAARPDMENVDDRPVPDATPAPSMNQVRKRSSSYSGQSSTSEIAPGLDLQAASDKASRRTHVRSASASVPGVLFQQAGSVNLVTRPGLRPSRSEDEIPASAKKIRTRPHHHSRNTASEACFVGCKERAVSRLSNFPSARTERPIPVRSRFRDRWP